METFLNILWLFIAAGVVAKWRTHWVHQRRQQRHARRNPAREWTAVGCALILLFFAVSLTDDLHFDAILFDECATGRRSTVGTCVHHAPQGRTAGHGSATANFTPMKSPAPLRTVGTILPVVFTEHASGKLAALSGRAPPSIDL
jgi:hypothetical protein